MNDPRLLRGTPLRNHIITQVQADMAALPPIGRLASIAIGDVAEVAVYIRNQKRLAEQAGIPFDDQYWPGI